MRGLVAAMLVMLSPAAVMAAEEPAASSESAGQAAQDRQAYAKSICDMISAEAKGNDLPEAFMARLIWKESLFDPGAISPKGAQGIAQFMPATAKRRGLEDPFDAKTALAASASYLAELKQVFGNLGLAAAAYNAGEERVSKWLAGNSGLPYETQDYVLSITGRSHDDWKAKDAGFPIPDVGKQGTFDSQCQSLVMRESSPQQSPAQRAAWKPWGVVLSGGFSEARALKAFRTLRGRYPALLKNEEPLVLRKRNLSMGRRKMVRVMVGRDSRTEAQQLCNRLTAAGAACLVEKN